MKTTPLLLALSLPCHAAISISLPGNSESASWTGLNSTNYTSAGGFPSYPTATDAWPNAIVPDSGSTLGAIFDKVSGGGYFASSSLYDAGTPGTFRVTDLSSLANLQTVVFQADLGSPLGGIPVLNYNGGEQNMAADFTATSQGDYLSGFGGPPAPTTNYAWQWDLSGVGAAITDFSIEWSTAPHGTVYQLDLAAGDSFTQAIPEPCALLLGAVSLSLATLRRSRA